MPPLLDEPPAPAIRPLPTPDALRRRLPLPPAQAAGIHRHRQAVRAVVNGHDRRLLVVVGPCSLHDPEAAREYARRLLPLARRHAGRLLVVLRAYCEKPRTALGWKGLVADPHLDGVGDLAGGLMAARRLLLDLTAIGLPLAVEVLDPLVSPYLDDLPAWACIGARTVESPLHRALASGLPMAVGFKNGTDGRLDACLGALRSAASPHSLLGPDRHGQLSVLRTAGNPHAHAVLRGGAEGSNCDPEAVTVAAAALARAGLNPRLLVDCSHGNCGRDLRRQAEVAEGLARRLAAGEPHLLGVMLESFLIAGRQEPLPGGRGLVYGQSVTDPCLGLEQTLDLLDRLAAAAASGRGLPDERALP